MAESSPSSERSPSQGRVAPRLSLPRHRMVPGQGVSGPHRIHCTEWGRPSSRRTVICVHGYGGNARDFDFLARALADDARVVCIDIAGRGESDWLPSGLDYHFGQLLADIDAVIADLGADEIEWVGTSMGGLLGLLLASRPATPVRRLVLNDIGAFVPMDALQHIARNLAAPERFASHAALEAHLRHTHRDSGDIGDAQYRHLTHHHGRRGDDGGLHMHYDPEIARLVQPFPMMPGLFFWDAWYGVRCPVLLVRGERSDVFPADVAETMLQIKPETQLAEVRGAGHAPALMSEREIGIVRGFLEPAAAFGGDGLRRGDAQGGLRSAA